MWLDDLVTLLTDAGVGTLGVNVFTSSKASIPVLTSGEATVQIIETAGSAPERTQNSVVRPGYIRPAAQFVVRAGTAEKARVKAQAAYNAVVGIRNSWVIDAGFTVSGWYREITPLQEPFDPGGGVDDRSQARCVFNVIAVRRP